MSERSWTLLPGSRPGRWSVGLIGVMPILFILGLSFSSSIYESVPAGSNLLADIAARPLLTISMLAGMAAGAAGLMTGLIAIFKRRERAILVYLSTVIGGLVTFFLVSLFIFPE